MVTAGFVDVVFRGKDSFTRVSANVSRGVSSVGASLSKFAGIAAGVTAAMVGVSAVIGVTSVKAFGNYEQAMREVTTLMGVGESAMASFGEEVRRLARELPIMGGQVAVTKGLYQTLSAGITDSAEAVKFLETALKTASAGLSDADTTVKALASVINAYGLEAKDAEQISDLLFTTVRFGMTTMPELAEGIGRVIAIAPTMGVSFKEVSAALATLTKTGQNTNQAVTALRQVMIGMAKPTEDLEAIITRLGFTNGITMLRTLGLQETIRALSNAVGGSEDAFIKMFNNVRAMQGILPLAGKAAGTFREALVEMDNSAGAAGAAFEQMNQTTQSAMTRMKNVIEDVKIEIGERLADSVKETIELMASPEGAEAFADFAEPFAKIAEGLVRIPIGIKIAADATAEFGDKLNVAATASKFFWDTFKVTGDLEKATEITNDFIRALDQYRQGIDQIPKEFGGAGEAVLKGLGLGPGPLAQFAGNIPEPGLEGDSVFTEEGKAQFEELQNVTSNFINDKDLESVKYREVITQMKIYHTTQKGLDEQLRKGKISVEDYIIGTQKNELALKKITVASAIAEDKLTVLARAIQQFGDAAAKAGRAGFGTKESRPGRNLPSELEISESAAARNILTNPTNIKTIQQQIDRFQAGGTLKAAAGGIIRKPQMINVGEGGDEVIAPLKSFEINVNVNNPVINSELDAELIFQRAAQQVKQELMSG